MKLKVKVITWLMGVALAGLTGFVIMSHTQASLMRTTTPSVLNGVSQTALQHCIASSHANCEAQVPGLSKCMAAGLQCNASAQVGATAIKPFAQTSVPSGMPLITRSSALTKAFADGAQLQAQVTSSTKTVAEEMTRAAADSLTGQVLNPALAANYPVWVVSVDATVTNSFGLPGAPPVTHPYYTVLLDGYTGSLIMSAAGVDSLHASTS